MNFLVNYCRDICAKWRPPIRWEPARISATWGCGGRDRAGRKEKRDFKESGLFLAAAAAAAAALLIRKQSREKDDASRFEVDPERASEGWRFHTSDIKRSVDSRFDMHLRIQKR